MEVEMMTYLFKIDNQLKQKINDLVKGLDLDRTILDEDIEQAYLGIPNKEKNINAYLTNFINSLDLKKYVRKRKIVSSLSLRLALKEMEFTGTDEELMLIELIEEHCLNEFPVTANQVIRMNHQIVEYIIASQKEKTYSTFIDLVLRSRTLRNCNIPVDELKLVASKVCAEWNEMMEELQPSPEEEEARLKKLEKEYQDGTIN